jgi:hypothetical protein
MRTRCPQIVVVQGDFQCVSRFFDSSFYSRGRFVFISRVYNARSSENVQSILHRRVDLFRFTFFFLVRSVETDRKAAATADIF